jgi:hypothetical protein
MRSLIRQRQAPSPRSTPVATGSPSASARPSWSGGSGNADPLWFTELAPLLAARAQTTFADAFVEFATWNLFTGSFADPARSYAASARYGRVKIEGAAAPYSAKLRIFYASAEYYRVPPGGRAAMTAALAAPSGAPEAIEGLTLLVVPEQGGAYGEVTRVSDLASGVEAVDTSAADALVVVVVNGLQEGESRQPTLCIGTAAEVAACRQAAEAGAGGAEPADGDHGGCGCRVLAGGKGRTGAGAAAALVLAALLGYRRRFL